MRLSNLGLLSDKFNHSGINKKEVISDEDLGKLLSLICDQLNISIDFQDAPNAEFWTRRGESVKRVIEARREN